MNEDIVKPSLVQAKCTDSDGEFTLFTKASADRMDLYRTVDRMLCCVTGNRFHFLSELNELQTNDDGEEVFERKSDIPLKIVNLVLAPYNMIIEETT